MTTFTESPVTRHDTVKWISVTEILNTIEGSCDDYEWTRKMREADPTEKNDLRTEFWLTIMSLKAADTGFGHLVESIQEHGFKEIGAIGWYKNGITEGHHRLTAAILLGLDEVPCSNSGKDFDINGVRMSAHNNSSVPHRIWI